MNTLIERFPKATLELPLEIRHEFNIFTATGRMLAGTGGTSSNVQDTYSQNVDNAKAIHHAISTYDARDAALVEAARVLEIGVHSIETNPAATAKQREEWGGLYRSALAEIESARAVKP